MDFAEGVDDYMSGDSALTTSNEIDFKSQIMDWGDNQYLLNADRYGSYRLKNNRFSLGLCFASTVNDIKIIVNGTKEFVFRNIQPLDEESQKFATIYRRGGNNTEYNGGITETKRNAKIRVTELERTVIDCLDRILLSGGLEKVFMALTMINYCDDDKLLKHLSGYGKKIIYKKAWYLFSVLKPTYLTERFYEECKRNMSECDDDIQENKQNAYVYSSEWKLYVPKQLMNTEN